MSVGLPSMAYSDGIKKSKRTAFGGYNHRFGAGDGEIFDMQNMSADLYPVLSPRKQRYLIRTLTKANGFFAKDEMYWVDGTGFYADGTLKGNVSDSKKKITKIGIYIIILPDKKYYNTENETFGSIEETWSGSATLQDGSYAGEDAEANTIYAANAAWSSKFKEGDAVTITGCQTHAANNKTAVVREISGDYLRFYENCFTINDGGDTETVTIKREMPELDFICENENRLWGCKDDTIYASKLGDPFNWNVFDGISTDSFAVNVGSAGDFTGCCSYLGYPCFFKEENIYKVYGDKPSNFQVMGSASIGVESGSAGSLAIAGETLFYLSRTGIVAYSGGIPKNISEAFGTERYRDAVAGSDGTKYYVSMKNANNEYSLFVFDTETNLWHREDATQVVGFGWNQELYFVDSTGKMWLNGNTRTVPQGATAEGMVTSWAEFADFVDNDPNKKGTGKIQIRAEVDQGASIEVFVMFDSNGRWDKVATIAKTTKQSFYLPIIPRRNDNMKIKLYGKGNWRVYSIVRESYSGSEL